MTPPPLPCPRCGKLMTLAARLPATNDLPAVAGYWCADCKVEQTIEEDAE